MISELLRKLAGVIWFLPGFILWAAFPPMGETADVLFALAPLLYAARTTTPRVSAKRWFQSGIFFWVATLSWMPAIVKNGGPWPLVVLGWGALAAYCAAYFAAFGYLSAKYWDWARLRSRPTPARLLGVLIVEPILWAGLELVRSRLFGGFAWNQLGVVPANAGFGGPAALGGVYLLSIVVVLINGTFAGIAERVIASIRRRPADRIRSLETALALLAVFGLYRLADAFAPTMTDAGSSRTLKVALVQRNFPCVFQRQEENPLTVYERLLGNVAALQPDLVVLSESALCEFGPADQQGSVRFAERVREWTGAALLAGGTRVEDGATYNSAALFSTNAPDVQFYDKVHLVPFGEYIPGDKLIPALQKLAPVGSCTPGTPKLLTLSPRSTIPSTSISTSPSTSTSTLNLGIAICFEDTDSALMRRFAADGADILCFITNDSWFSRSIEAEQHAWQARARAIETGLPVVRVGNSGVSGTIQPDGRATWLSGPNGRPLVDASGTMFDRLVLPSAPRQHPTVYVRLGDSPLAIAFSLILLAFAVKAYHRRRQI